MVGKAETVLWRGNTQKACKTHILRLWGGANICTQTKLPFDVLWDGEAWADRVGVHDRR